MRELHSMMLGGVSQKDSYYNSSDVAVTLSCKNRARGTTHSSSTIDLTLVVQSQTLDELSSYLPNPTGKARRRNTQTLHTVSVSGLRIE